MSDIPSPERAAFLRAWIEDVIEYGWEKAFTMWEYSYDKDFGLSLWEDGEEDTDSIYQMHNGYNIIGTLMNQYWRRTK